MSSRRKSVSVLRGRRVRRTAFEMAEGSFGDRVRKKRKSKPVKTGLERLHEAPFWFGNGKLINLGRNRRVPKKIAGDLRSNDPVRIASAEQKLKQHFDYYAKRKILEYFRMKPNSPVSFEHIYARMLQRVFPYFVSGTREKGLWVSSGGMQKALTLSSKPSHLRGFETNFVAREDFFGEWGKSKTRLPSPRLFPLLVEMKRRGVRTIRGVELREEAEAVLAKIPDERNREMVRLYFGIGVPSMSFSQLEKKFGMTSTGARLLVKRELEKIRRSRM
jgi:hypothetical protein